MAQLIHVDDLVDATHVASAVGLTHRNSVATYMRRYGDFPRPLVETAGGRCRLWSRAEVERWIATRRSAGKVRGK
jgi:glutathione-regulated potassium-efflux system ancillary protein KefG